PRIVRGVGHLSVPFPLPMDCPGKVGDNLVMLNAFPDHRHRVVEILRTYYYWMWPHPVTTRRFQKFAHSVLTNSPYYAELMRTYNINPLNCRIEQFPVLTKENYNDQFD